MTLEDSDEQKGTIRTSRSRTSANRATYGQRPSRELVLWSMDLEDCPARKGPMHTTQSRAGANRAKGPCQPGWSRERHWPTMHWV